jgi:hypothetical protein
MPLTEKAPEKRSGFAMKKKKKLWRAAEGDSILYELIWTYFSSFCMLASKSYSYADPFSINSTSSSIAFTSVSLNICITYYIYYLLLYWP